jgi:hypothetical protein
MAGSVLRVLETNGGLSDGTVFAVVAPVFGVLTIWIGYWMARDANFRDLPPFKDRPTLTEFLFWNYPRPRADLPQRATWVRLYGVVHILFGVLMIVGAIAIVVQRLTQ